MTSEQKAEIEFDYLKYKKFQRERKDKPLTNEEWLSFFILPFFTTKPRWREDHFTESEMERFEKYGFEKKYQQAQKIRASAEKKRVILLTTVLSLVIEKNKIRFKILEKKISDSLS